MFRKRLIVFTSVALMIGGLAFILFQNMVLDKRPEAISTEFGDEVSNTRLSAVHHVAKRDGVREWALDANSARYQKDQNRTILEGVMVRFFGKDGNTIEVTGTKGILYTDSMDMDVSGGVLVVAGSRRLTTERLHYDHQDRCVFTDTPVTITDEGITLAGNFMRFSLSKREGSIWGEVRAVFDRPEMSFIGS